MLLLLITKMIHDDTAPIRRSMNTNEQGVRADEMMMMKMMRCEDIMMDVDDDDDDGDDDGDECA